MCMDMKAHQPNMPVAAIASADTFLPLRLAPPGAAHAAPLYNLMSAGD